MIGQIVTKETKKDLTVVIGKDFRTVPKTDKGLIEKVRNEVELYNKTADVEVREDIKERLLTMLAPGRKIEMASDKRFMMDEDGVMTLKGTSEAIPEFLAKKLLQFIEDGIDIDSLVNFWRRLLLNPDKHVRTQLYKFLENNGHPITSRGYFLAYKSVAVKRKYDKETGEKIIKVEYDEDTGERVEEKFTQEMTFEPHHSGPHGMVIKVGEPVTMPREECDNNPDNTCSRGLHVGSMAYVGDFGCGDKVVLECLISPTDVVSVPSDYNATKMRTCKYYPIAISNGENKEIFLEHDYDEHQKGYLEEQMKEYRSEVDERIQKLQESIQQSGDLIDELY
jgi:hypothetical protein